MSTFSLKTHPPLIKSCQHPDIQNYPVQFKGQFHVSYCRIYTKVTKLKRFDFFKFHVKMYEVNVNQHRFWSAKKVQTASLCPFYSILFLVPLSLSLLSLFLLHLFLKIDSSRVLTTFLAIFCTFLVLFWYVWFFKKFFCKTNNFYLYIFVPYCRVDYTR